MSTPLQSAVASLYAEVDAPGWVATNLDGLADVLRDLSWLPPGPVTLALPDIAALGEDDAGRLAAVLLRAETETADGPRPVRIRT